MDEIKGKLFLEVDHPHLAVKFTMELPRTLSRRRVAVSIVSFLGRRIILSEGTCSLLPLWNPWQGLPWWMA